MQLNVSRTTPSLLRRVLTLLALCLCVTPALAGVLPDDRTDALYHRYQGGGITVQGPSVLIQKKITDNFAVTLDGQNLNNPILKYYALGEYQPRAFYRNGSQYYLNVRFKL